MPLGIRNFWYLQHTRQLIRYFSGYSGFFFHFHLYNLDLMWGSKSRPWQSIPQSKQERSEFKKKAFCKNFCSIRLLRFYCTWSVFRVREAKRHLTDLMHRLLGKSLGRKGGFGAGQVSLLWPNTVIPSRYYEGCSYNTEATGQASQLRKKSVHWSSMYDPVSTCSSGQVPMAQQYCRKGKSSFVALQQPQLCLMVL